MSTLFVADLHLEPARAATVDFAARTFRGAARHDALWILGDLFESWIGDDHPSDGLDAVIDALRDLAAGGTAVHLMHGNRDFLLGDDFARRTGATLHREDEVVVELDGTRALLLHGDTLCTRDVDYQRMRATVRDPGWQADMLARDAAERLAIAGSLRRDSGRATSAKEQPIMDVDADAVAARFAAHDLGLMIHGHTHRPADHGPAPGASAGGDAHGHVGRARRLVLGDWHEDHAMVVLAANGSVDLMRLDA